MGKKYIGINVLEAAKKRISYTFDTFKKVCVSFSGGKDSTVMLHMVMEEAIKRNRKVGLLFIDWEAQFKITINHIQDMFIKYKDYIEPYWISLPMTTDNSVSVFEPEWICWEKDKDWVRPLPEISIKDYDYFPFYNYAMTFEEFVPKFSKWYSNGELTATLVGIRSDESLNRYVTVGVAKKEMYNNKNYTTKVIDNVYNVYPIYDWRIKDLWLYNYRYKKEYNKLYDIMYKAGVPLSCMRICEPYGQEQKRGLWLYHIIEPDTWNKVVYRVNGANSGALFAKEHIKVLGGGKLTKPENHTWKSFSMMLLESFPPKTKLHYENKIAIYLKWCKDHGEDVPDSQDKDTGSKDIPSWKRICKTLLKNDYWCKTLSFGINKVSNYNKYLELIKKRRATWGNLW